MKDLALLLANCNPVWNTRKTCSRCQQRKYLRDFSPHPQTRDGVQSSCKTCCRERARG